VIDSPHLRFSQVVQLLKKLAKKTLSVHLIPQLLLRKKLQREKRKKSHKRFKKELIILKYLAIILLVKPAL
jgi:predicted flavoprotein YhiN